MTITINRVRHHDRLDYKIAVSNGINLLDREEPGWRDNIDTDTLDVSDCTQCILAQVYGHFNTGLNRLDMWDHPDDYGFALVGGDYAQLTDQWKLALNA